MDARSRASMRDEIVAGGDANQAKCVKSAIMSTVIR
jgi:hypothetical protein